MAQEKLQDKGNKNNDDNRQHEAAQPMVAVLARRTVIFGLADHVRETR